MSDCVFCRIVRGELPCAKLYEDDEVLAFMDIAPIIKGHALVIPKHHIDPLTRRARTSAGPGPAGCTEDRRRADVGPAGQRF
jgi:hypothetical protein